MTLTGGDLTKSTLRDLILFPRETLEHLLLVGRLRFEEPMILQVPASLFYPKHKEIIEHVGWDSEHPEDRKVDHTLRTIIWLLRRMESRKVKCTTCPRWEVYDAEYDVDGEEYQSLPGDWNFDGPDSDEPYCGACLRHRESQGS